MILGHFAISSAAAFPDADEARAWAEQELTKAEYLAAQPNAFDRASLAVLRFFEDLLDPDFGDGSSGVIIVTLVCLLLVVALVVGVVLWGKPRASRKLRPTQILLGEQDSLSADELRLASERAARTRDWGTAMTQRFRALARGLVEREMLDPAPGATAQHIARAAAATFPAQRAPLLEAAALFDEVRYLGASGDERSYLTIRAADEAVSSSPVQLLETQAPA